MSKTISQILSIVAEDFVNFTLPELKEMESTLQTSKNPKKKLKLDIITTTIKNKVKELKALGEQGELELVENSKKVIPSTRKRNTEKGKTKVSPAKPIHKEDEEAEKKKKVTVKAKQKEAEQEEAEDEDGEEAESKVLISGKMKYTPLDELQDVKELPKFLLENPYKIFALINEGDGINTVFLVIYADHERVIMMDSGDKSVLTLSAKGINPEKGYVTFDRKKYKAQFYIQSPIEEKEEKKEEKKGA